MNYIKKQPKKVKHKLGYNYKNEIGTEKNN